MATSEWCHLSGSFFKAKAFKPLMLCHSSSIFGQMHYACANGADIEVVRILLDAYPGSILITDKRGRTPLHFALGNVDNPPTPDLVMLLIGTTGEVAKRPDENSMLPIHYACAYGACAEVLMELVRSWEESLTITDSKGRLPLHFAMGNADRKNSPEVVKLLLELNDDPGVIVQKDSEKNLPLHLISTKAESINEEDIQTQTTMCKCMDIYLKAKPKTCTELLTAIQNMPEWLQDVAVVHPTVQTMLNTKISSRFPTMILLLDFYFLVGIIATFSITSIEALKRRFNPLNDTNDLRSVSGAMLSALYIGALYFLIREITQMISVRNQTTVLAYLADLENILNLSFVFLTTFYTIQMQTGTGDDNRFRIGAALTMGVCYLQVLAYLKSISIDFAVFVSGAVYVTTRLVAFMTCMMISIVLFAQMWYTLFKQSSQCVAAEEDPGNETEAVPMDDMFYFDDMVTPEVEEVEDCEPSLDAPFCHSLYFSIYKTYTMMLGEIDDTLFYWNTFSLFLFCIFFFMEVVILLNILIAIITDLYGVITNDRAEIVFWSNRLAFIIDMDMVTDGPLRQTVLDLFNLDDDNDDTNNRASNSKKNNVDVSWERILWDKLCGCFDPDEDARTMKVILYAPLRVFVSMFIIPFWLLLGILSAGWFWPPQVREGLFVQKVTMSNESGETNELERRIEEVVSLKKELLAVQEHLIGQSVEDRKDMTNLVDQVIDIKRELKDEMKNIKTVMTSLFQLQQQVMAS
ncbi:hypothetical protein ACHAWF_007110 [Thalassiosira exigua]